MNINDKFEHLIKKTLRENKEADKVVGKCLSEEQFACFIEEKFSASEREGVEKHLFSCRQCRDVLRDQLLVIKTMPQQETLTAPEKAIERAKGLVTEEVGANILDIVLSIKETALEIIRTTGDILRGPELIPLAVLRGREKEDTSDEVRVVKRFQEVLADVQIEKKKSHSTDLIIRLTEKATKKKVHGIRVTLVRGNREIESCLVEDGKAKFEEVKTGNYRVILAREDKKIGIITLSMN